MAERRTFHDRVFKRDLCTCRVCGAPARDAHHIIPRGERGHSDETSNGIALCADCHLVAEADEALSRLATRLDFEANLYDWSRRRLLALARESPK